MPRSVSRFWTAVTIVLSLLFAVLFFPVVNRQYGLTLSLVFTGAGIGIIWLVYAVRAHIFSRLYSESDDESHGSTQS